MMSKTNNFVFWGLYIVAWLIFVGLCIEAGSLIVNFFFSLYKPEFVQNLYQNLDLTELYNNNNKAFGEAGWEDYVNADKDAEGERACQRLK